MRRKKLTRIDEKRRLPLRCLLHLYHPMTIITVNIFIFLVIIIEIKNKNYWGKLWQSLAIRIHGVFRPSKKIYILIKKIIKSFVFMWYLWISKLNYLILKLKYILIGVLDLISSNSVFVLNDCLSRLQVFQAKPSKFIQLFFHRIVINSLFLIKSK